MEYLENKMVAQESVIANVELRNLFSLHCLHMETQLVHAHFEILDTVLQSLVSVQIRGHSEVYSIYFSLIILRLINLFSLKKFIQSRILYNNSTRNYLIFCRVNFDSKK